MYSHSGQSVILVIPHCHRRIPHRHHRHQYRPTPTSNRNSNRNALPNHFAFLLRRVSGHLGDNSDVGILYDSQYRLHAQNSNNLANTVVERYSLCSRFDYYEDFHFCYCSFVASFCFCYSYLRYRGLQPYFATLGIVLLVFML